MALFRFVGDIPRVFSDLIHGPLIQVTRAPGSEVPSVQDGATVDLHPGDLLRIPSGLTVGPGTDDTPPAPFTHPELEPVDGPAPASPPPSTPSTAPVTPVPVPAPDTAE